MVSGYYHQRTKHYFFVSRFFDLFDHCFTCGIFRLAFYSSDKYILVSQIVHLALHLAVADLCSVRSSVSHEYECGSVCLCRIQIIISCSFYCLCCDGFCYCFFVIIDCIVTVPNFS